MNLQRCSEFHSTPSTLGAFVTALYKSVASLVHVQTSKCSDLGWFVSSTSSDCATLLKSKMPNWKYA